jgi:hypothetical protein
MVSFAHILTVFYLLCSCVGLAQTKVDLSNQTKTVDLSNLGPTKPVQKGTVVPATCAVGQMFFKADAVPGANLYACVSANAWVVLAAGGGGLTNSGVSVAGNLPVYLDSSGTQLVDSGVSGSPAVLMTQPIYQSGKALDCTGRVGDTSGTMSCLLTPALSGYGLHMLLRFTPAVANAGGFTLNVNSLGPVPVKTPDCSTDPNPGYFQPNQTYLLTYNGASLCEVHSGGTSVTALAPYLLLESSHYLPFGFLATLPPVSGWLASNFTGAAFTTTGLGGMVQIQSAASRTAESLNLQTTPLAGASTLIAAISAAGFNSASPSGACGVGVYNSVNGAGYVLFQQVASPAFLEEAGYSSATVQTFAGSPVLTNIGELLYVRIDLSGSNVIPSYSRTGSPGSWIQVNSRALGSTGMPTSVDSWSFFAEPSSTSAVTCRLLSWNVF